MSAIDFNDFSKQRLVLGVGGANRTINEQWQGIPHERVLTKMAEYVALIQRMARTRLGETLDFEGRIHRMHWSPAVDPGDRPFPVYLAAVFPRMLKVAGRVADGIACGATLSVDYLRDVVRPQVIDAAITAGRDPDAALTHMPAGHLEAAVAAIPDECIDSLVIAGTPEDCRARLTVYESVVDEIVLLNALPAGDDGVEESYASLMQLVESHRNHAT